MTDLVKSLVHFGKKYFPPPVILFVAHLLYATVVSIVYVINTVIDDNGSYCYSGWTTALIWVFGLIEALLVAFVKYRQSEEFLPAIISFFAFWATLFGIQHAPFFCHYKSKTAYIIGSLLRALIDILLSVIFVSWCKSKIDKFLNK
ncbi:hypothetical protein ACHWQZ_G001412 [Mnemiopsis leidyi]